MSDISDVSIDTMNKTIIDLQESVKELTCLLENADCGIQICKDDDDFTIVYANDGFYKLIGYTKEELEEKFDNKFAPLITDNLEDKMADIRNSMLDRGEFVTGNIEYGIKHKSGNIVHVIDKFKYVVSQNGEKHFQCVLTDITQQYVLKNKLTTNNIQLNTLASNVEGGIIICNMDPRYHVIYANNYFYKMIGYTKEEFSQIHDNYLGKLIHPDDRQALYEVDNQNFNLGDRSTCKYRIMRKDGSIVHVLENGAKIMSDDGMLQFYAFITDISEEVRNNSLLMARNDELKLSQVKYEMAIKYADVAIFEYIIPEHKVVHAIDNDKNYFFDGLLGDPRVVADNYDVIHPQSADTYRNLYKRIEQGERFVEGTVVFFDKYHQEETYRIYLSSVIKQDGSSTRAIGVLKNITKHSLLEKERRYREVMISNKVLSYEANLCQDKVLMLDGDWVSQKMDMPFSQFIKVVKDKYVHEDDLKAYGHFHDYNRINKDLEDGINKFAIEYRRKNLDGEYNWVREVMNVIRDSLSKDIAIRGFVSLINKEKLRELDLIHRSEHDGLTDFYNKNMTEELIDSYLHSDNHQGNSGFFIIDIDYFKSINDNFGHIYGDVVLGELSRKLKSLFRDDDIIGRIGGDEFIVFMKKVSDMDAITNKAKEICSKLKEKYTKDDNVYQVSVSIGVAISGYHGNSYKELYCTADSALYVSKSNGRGKFTIYDGNMSTGECKNKVIDYKRLAALSFTKNLRAYVFELLYTAKDMKAAINSVLELMGKHYGVGRIYVFEQFSDGSGLKGTFEWFDQGLSPMKDKFQNIKYGMIGKYKDYFNDMGIFYLPDISVLPANIIKFIGDNNIKGCLQVALIKNGDFLGCVGYNFHDNTHELPTEVLVEMRDVAAILGVFVMSLRGDEKLELANNVVMSILNGFKEEAYVLDSDDFKILSFNNMAKADYPGLKVGDVCYKYLFGCSKPCEGCPVLRLTQNNESDYEVSEVYREKSDVWDQVSASWVQWKYDKNDILVLCNDVSERKLSKSGQ